MEEKFLSMMKDGLVTHHTLTLHSSCVSMNNDMSVNIEPESDGFNRELKSTMISLPEDIDVTMYSYETTTSF